MWVQVEVDIANEEKFMSDIKQLRDSEQRAIDEGHGEFEAIARMYMRKSLVAAIRDVRIEHKHDWGEVFVTVGFHELCYIDGCEHRRWSLRSEDE